MASNLSSAQHINLKERFIAESLKAVSFIHLTNKHTRPFVSERLPYFNPLSDISKNAVIANLKLFNQVCEQVVASGGSVLDSRVMIWHVLKLMDFIFPSDLFDHITSDHIVEIYDFNNIQIFRNLRFFDATSYSLEELLCRPWVDIFSRKDNSQISKITDVLTKMRSKEITGLISLKDIGVNRIIETDSPFLLQNDALIHFAAPITNKSKQVVSYIAIESAELMTPMPEGLEAERLLNTYYDSKK